ncbi:DUF554 domain-containing protein [Brevibacillus sp. B_LB10_24]|uniref:DUF554 domain-containing protein n=1 Tax=Brevibacillus sp. B_LB10_24 TaxID=3380645 RepID=UPI0038B7CF9D
MIFIGTLVNAAAIIAGAVIGKLLSRIPDGIRKTVMQGLGLAVVFLGLQMSFKTQNFLLLIISLVIGSILGEIIRIEHYLNVAGQWLESKAGDPNKGGSIATGFVNATLVYCIGAMAVLGAMDSGLRGNHDILFTKAMIDGFSSVIFTSTMGIGVAFAAIPVLLYQGAIAILSTQIYNFIGSDMLNSILAEVTAVGGLLIVGIGINILELKKINVANMLPSLVIAAVSVPIADWFTH